MEKTHNYLYPFIRRKCLTNINSSSQNKIKRELLNPFTENLSNYEHSKYSRIIGRDNSNCIEIAIDTKVKLSTRMGKRNFSFNSHYNPSLKEEKVNENQKPNKEKCENLKKLLILQKCSKYNELKNIRLRTKEKLRNNYKFCRNQKFGEKQKKICQNNSQFIHKRYSVSRRTLHIDKTPLKLLTQKKFPNVIDKLRVNDSLKINFIQAKKILV